jgi:hypothetical protein
LPLPASVLKGVGPFLVNPVTRGRAITLTFGQFTYGWANALEEEKEARELYERFHVVAGSGIALVQMGTANLNPWTQAKANTKNPDRGPLLIIDGEKDHTVPWAGANAAYKLQRHNPAVTEIVRMPNRGHSLTIDHGWREVAPGRFFCALPRRRRQHRALPPSRVVDGPRARHGGGAMTAAMLKLPMTAGLLVTLFLGSDGFPVIPLTIAAVVVAYLTGNLLTPATLRSREPTTTDHTVRPRRLPARVRANSGPQPWIVGSTAPRPTRNAARAAAAISASSPTTLPTRVAAISPAMSSTFTP